MINLSCLLFGHLWERTGDRVEHVVKMAPCEFTSAALCDELLSIDVHHPPKQEQEPTISFGMIGDIKPDVTMTISSLLDASETLGTVVIRGLLNPHNACARCGKIQPPSDKWGWGDE